MADSKLIANTMQIGSLSTENPYILAPLAGYTDLPFRLLCREQGAGLCFSEMISCHGLVFGQEKTLEMLASVQDERPVAFQLFGNEAEIMGKAAAVLSKRSIDLIDINMGCPVKKVVRKGAGAALLKDIHRAEAIIKAVVSNTHLPVSVKCRIGWKSDTVIAESFARLVEDAGASAITVHGRTWSQGFGGHADWSIIKQVKQTVTIPVIGNGDVLSFQDGQQMMEKTGCDGVMIGRGTLGNPWVFQESGIPHTLDARLPVIVRHIELIQQYLPERLHLFKVKNNVSRYMTGIPGASKTRKQIYHCASIKEILSLLDGLCNNTINHYSLS